MGANSSIEWTDRTWNCLTGCTPVSHGCTNCYAAQLAATRLKDTPRYKGLAVLNSRNQGVFTGIVRMHEDKLLEPLSWRKPARVFVNSMSDVFHESVPFDFIDKMFAVMAVSPQHTFQVLTKRPERMAEYFTRGALPGSVAYETIWNAICTLGDARKIVERRVEELGGYEEVSTSFPTCPNNVWLGTSVENQETADERIPHLLNCPAAVRFLSVEPLLGPVDLRNLAYHDGIEQVGNPPFLDGLSGLVGHPRTCINAWPPEREDTGEWNGIHWVIVGGESGPHARPMEAEWARSLRDQCVAAKIPFFFKQWGGIKPKSGGRLLDGRLWDEYPAGQA
jgi:protein gp37